MRREERIGTEAILAGADGSSDASNREEAIQPIFVFSSSRPIERTDTRMEAIQNSRQERLQTVKELYSQSSTSANVHPFRRAFLSDLSITLHQRQPDNKVGTEKVIASTAESQLLLRYRNWDPLTGQAKQGVWNTIDNSIEADVQQIQRQALQDDQQHDNEELKLEALAPKRANWDLKQHWKKRIHKLKKMDQKARMTLIRQRLKSQSQSSTAQDQVATAAAVQLTGDDKIKKALVDFDQSDSDSDSSQDE
ncbi:unnamed protein product [Sympodiomycopsis kandeliae]